MGMKDSIVYLGALRNNFIAGNLVWPTFYFKLTVREIHDDMNG